VKEIKAIIQPHMLSKVIDALQSVEDLPGITVSEVRGFGRNRARAARNKVVEDYIEYARKSKLEIVVPDSLLDRVVQTITQNARTGHPGDGLIFVSDVGDVFGIRTGERRTDA
jgi:nitrogen regulatory protein P-II 1